MLKKEFIMSLRNDLNKLQRQVYWSYHQDGLIDILFGLGVIGFGLMLVTGNVIFGTLAWLPWIFYMPIKNAITVPRLGFVKIQTKRTLKWAVISIGVGVVMLAFVFVLIGLMRGGYLSPGWQALLTQYDTLLIATLLSVPLIIISALSGLKRMIGYVGMIFLIALVGIKLGIELPIISVVDGIAILAIGLFYLSRFLYRHPIGKTENAE
jgi:hypothetical protein